MDDLIKTFIHVLAYFAGAAGLLLVITRFIPSGRILVQRAVGGQELWFAFAAALAMTASSLYLSEVLHFIPCRMCWIQRIFAYPLVVVLGWAAWRRDRNAWAPTLTLAVLGIAASVWHILLDVGWISESSSCDPNNPCTLRWGWAGDGVGQWFATIQVGAFCCFLFIIGLGLHALAPSTESPAEA